MTLTAEERRAVNRKNAAHSTGPKTPEGRARAARNALKHGLRAETLALPGEDAQRLRQMTEEWVEYYRPASPAQRVLLDQAVYAAVQLERCRTSQTAAVARQVREAQAAWDYQRADEVEQLWSRLAEDPAGTVRALKRTADGCARMIAQWEKLEQVLEVNDSWLDSERMLASRLLGLRPEATPTNHDACYLKLLNFSAAPQEWAGALRNLLTIGAMPDTVWASCGGEPEDREHSWRELRRIVAHELALLQGLAERHRAEFDEPARAGAVEEAVLLQGEDATRWARYEKMYEGMFHRAYNGLLKAQAVEGVVEEEPETSEPVASAPESAAAPVEPEAEAGPPPDGPPAPNEANEVALVVPVAPALVWQQPVSAAVAAGSAVGNPVGAAVGSGRLA